jgi:hypothetical protein
MSRRKKRRRQLTLNEESLDPNSFNIQVEETEETEETKLNILKEFSIKLRIKLNIFKIKVYNYFNRRFARFVIKHKVSIIVYCITLAIFTTLYCDYTKHLGIFFQKESVMLEKSRKDYEAFRKIKPQNLHLRWLLTLADFKKESGPDLKLGAIEKVVNSLGANVTAKDSNILAKKIDAYMEVGLTYAISISQVKPGDFIIFKPKWVNGKQIHDRVGLVEEVTSNGYVKYVDWNEGIGTLFQTVRSTDPSIEKFVEFSWPIWTGTLLHNGIRVTRGFSEVKHYGIDFRMSNSERAVYSFTDGVVVKAYNKYDSKFRWTQENSGGNYCIVRSKYHGQIVYLEYFHLENLSVKLGDTIAKNTKLGNYADIGYSFGRHCHLSVFYKFANESPSEPMDPMPLLAENTSFILFNEYLDIDDPNFVASNQFMDHPIL